MPKDWASSGARLPILGLDVEFQDEPCMRVAQVLGDDESINPMKIDIFTAARPILGERRDIYSLRVLQPGSFTGSSGAIQVPAMTEGAWAQVTTGKQGEYRLRFMIDFPEGARRNDVELPVGRLVFTTRCFLSSSTTIVSDTVECPGRPALRVRKTGSLCVKRVRTIGSALAELGRNPTIKWGEGLFTVGTFTMAPQTMET